MFGIGLLATGVGGFFAKYWKILVIPVAAAAIFFAGWWTGKQGERNKEFRRQAKETLERVQEERRVSDEGRDFKDKVRRVREDPTVPPNDIDRFYECLLSSEQPTSCDP